MAKIFIWLGRICLAISMAIILFGYGSIWYFEGFGKLQEVLNPFNFVNVIAVIVAILPGYGFIKLGERLEAKQKELTEDDIVNS